MSGVLDAGNEMDIAQKRKEYWNIRKRLSKQEKRKNETEFKIYLTDKELQIITRSANGIRTSKTQYIKLAALAYANQHVIINQAQVNYITQLLALNSSFLQELTESTPVDIADTLLHQMTNLEQQVITALCNLQTTKSPAP